MKSSLAVRYIEDPRIKYLHVNMRTHTGILNVAACVVDLMYELFPRLVWTGRLLVFCSSVLNTTELSDRLLWTTISHVVYSALTI